MPDTHKTWALEEIIFSLTKKLQGLTPAVLTAMVEDLERGGERGKEAYLLPAVKLAQMLQECPISDEDFMKMIQKVMK